jgi:hypothetical protein
MATKKHIAQALTKSAGRLVSGLNNRLDARMSYVSSLLNKFLLAYRSVVFIEEGS